MEDPIHRRTKLGIAAAASVPLVLTGGIAFAEFNDAPAQSAAAPGDGAESPIPPVDVNGDGTADTVVSGTRDGGEGASYAGVLLGGEDGLDPERSSVVDRADLGIPEGGEDDTALDPIGTGDLNGDGHTDLILDAGTGYVAWGGPDGLTGEAVELPWLSYDDPMALAAVSLAVADMDGDGSTDVAVLDHVQGSPVGEYETAFHRGPFDESGAPAATEPLELPAEAEDGSIEAFDADSDASADLLLRLNADESPVSHIVLPSTEAGPATGDPVETPAGHAIATGDTDADGTTDLLIGAHGIPNNENPPGDDDPELHPGRVDAYLGFDTGAEPVRTTRDSEGVPGDAEDADGFGSSVATGDADGDGYTDTAVATGPFHSTKAFTVLPGGPDGPTGAGSATVTIDDPSGGWWNIDTFADVNGDGIDDLLLSTASLEEAGSSYTLYLGTADGLSEEPAAEFTAEGL